MKLPKLTLLFSLVGLLALCVLYLPILGTAADQTVYQVNIATQPSSGFLKASNMAPGDQVMSILQVSNKGNLDVDYSVSASMETGGSSTLYNDLMLTLSDDRGVLYQGSLSNLKNFGLGTLAIGALHNLTFSAQLPLATGNAAQSLSTSVAFAFTAVAHEDDECDCFEPPFSNDDFTLQQKSTVPIKFHFETADDQIDSMLHPNAKLVITGPSAGGGLVAYTFQLRDGTLRFDGSHYLALVSTTDYPMVSNQVYTATVYDGSTSYCYRQFLVLDNGNRSNN